MRSGVIDVEGMGTLHAIHMHDYSNGRAEAHAILSTRSTACEICCANTATT